MRILTHIRSCYVDSNHHCTVIHCGCSGYVAHLRMASQIMTDLLEADVANGAVREATITAGIKHPAIVQTLAHAVCADDEGMEGSNPVGGYTAWIMMEYCDRGTLGVCTPQLPRVRRNFLNLNRSLFFQCGIMDSTATEALWGTLRLTATCRPSIFKFEEKLVLRAWAHDGVLQQRNPRGMPCSTVRVGPRKVR